MQKAIQKQIETSAKIMLALSKSKSRINKIMQASTEISERLLKGGKLLICGNGGSAADAQHMAAEFVNRLSKHRWRPPIAAIALTTDTSVITAISNDLSFDNIFERQVHAIGKEGDVLLAITTSGKSENVLNALCAARSQGIITIALTGRDDSSQLAVWTDIIITVPATETSCIQECHLVIEHIMCSLIEDKVYPKG